MVNKISTQQPDYIHAIRINQIIDAAGLGVAKVSVQQPEYIYALKLNEIIDALDLDLKPLSVQQPDYVSALRINEIIDALSALRYAYDFNGSTDFGTLAARAIDPDADIDIQWSQSGGVLNAFLQTVVSQSLSTVLTEREFMMRWDNGRLSVYVGGTPVILTSYGILQTDGTWRFTLIGTVTTVYKNGEVVYTNPNRPRGAAREPSAVTIFGARNNLDFFQGLLFNYRINGVEWVMGDNTSNVQVSSPPGNSLTLVNYNADHWQQISASSVVSTP